jgi:hypothetical protein
MTEQISQSMPVSEDTASSTLPKKVVRKILWRQLFLQASFNYERMQACGFLWAISHPAPTVCLRYGASFISRDGESYCFSSKSECQLLSYKKHRTLTGKA